MNASRNMFYGLSGGASYTPESMEESLESPHKH